MKSILIVRKRCVSMAKTIKQVEKKLDYGKLRHMSKVPDQPLSEQYYCNEEVEIDKSTLQLLERLSLVHLDGGEALKTLKNSIQFAKRIQNIDLRDKKPLYTVLDNKSLQLRDDIINEENSREEILCNAKIVEDYFVSPPGNISLKQETDVNY